MKFLRRYICVKQQDATDCAAACLATVARTCNLKVSIATIRQFAGTNSQGTTVLGVAEAARKLGFEAKAVRIAKESLEQTPLPAIFHVVQGHMQHYVVVHEITAGHVIVADPAAGVREVARDEFLSIWT